MILCTCRDLDHSGTTASAARPMTKPLPVSSDTKTFDATAEAARLREQTRARRRNRHAVSRLDWYAAELQSWLADRRIRVHHSTDACGLGCAAITSRPLGAFQWRPAIPNNGDPPQAGAQLSPG